MTAVIFARFSKGSRVLGNEINPNVPVTKLRDGDTLVMDTGADATADGGYGANSGSMSADEGM